MEFQRLSIAPKSLMRTTGLEPNPELSGEEDQNMRTRLEPKGKKDLYSLMQSMMYYQDGQVNFRINY